jgi:hypothetical protein
MVKQIKISLKGKTNSVKEPRNANLRIDSATQFTIIAIKINCNQNNKIKENKEIARS